MKPFVDPVQNDLKRSKFSANAGRAEDARVEAELAHVVASRNKRLYGKWLPITEHRQAMAWKMLGQYKNAEEHFDRALATFNRGDRIGYAILLRDYGFFLVNELRARSGSHEEGVKKIEAAKSILRGTFPEDEAKRAKLELVVTRGFMYRARLRLNRFDIKALDGLKRTDMKLRELADTKPGYVLDNIVWILKYETRVKEVNSYLPRAIALSIQVGNLKRTAEHTIMFSGGQVVRATLDRFFSP